MKYIKYILPLLLVVTFSNSQDVKEKDQDETDIKTIIESQRFEFVAESVTPARGRYRNLTTEYTFVVSPDTVVSNLPFFGRAYQAPMDPANAGHNFTSKNFTYSLKEQKKGGWDIAIKTKDVNNLPQVSLSITKNGYASVRINSTDRESISYRGYIRKKPS